MPAYNEALAERILAELDKHFPHFVSDLQSKKPEFSAVPRDEWKRTVSALEKLGHIKASFHMEGIATATRTVDDLEITAGGRKELEQARRGSMTQRSYYWLWLQQFGIESRSKWGGSIISGILTAVGGYFVLHDPETLTNMRHTVLTGLFGFGCYLTYDFLRSPWMLQQKLLAKEALPKLRWARTLGASLFVLLVAGGITSVYFNVTPKKHKYAIDFADPQYANISNTLGAFQTLSVATPTCFVRVTAPFENRGIRGVLERLGAVYCKMDKPLNPAGPQEEVLKGSVDNGIVIHMAKDPQIRDGFVTGMGNVFSVKRTYDLPPGSPPDLVWIQVGHGYPVKRDDGSSGIE